MKSKKVVLVTGIFNVLHPGHMRLLRFAKDCGNYLIVGVESDKLVGVHAHVLQELRLEGVKSNTLVDEAFIISESVVLTIEKIRPDPHFARIIILKNMGF